MFEGDMWLQAMFFSSIMDKLPAWQLGGPLNPQLGYMKDIDVKSVNDIHMGKSTLCDFHLVVLTHH
jgi:hypothetical protein